VADRNLSRIVNFLHPFELGGVDGEQPAGPYRVETVDERLESLSMTAYRRISTTITLPSMLTVARSQRVVAIDPTDLARALERDANGGQPNGLGSAAFTARS
jgi:hypothetical protein